MVSIDAFQALDPGSIPGHRRLFYFPQFYLTEYLHPFVTQALEFPVILFLYFEIGVESFQMIAVVAELRKFSIRALSPVAKLQ